MMKSQRSKPCLGLALSLLIATSSIAIADDRRERHPQLTPDSPASSANKTATMYRPPKLGKPIATIGGGSRGPGVPTPFVLAPPHMALTAQSQSDLYWYLPSLTTHSIILTIIDYAGIEDQPLWEQALRPPTRPGLQRIQLSKLGVHLKPGIAYEWTIAVAPNLEKRSLDSIARGGIEYRQLSAALKKEIDQGSPAQVPYLYAKSGYWYDALSTFSSLIVTSSQDASLWTRRRAALLKEVALPDSVVQGSLESTDSGS